jgi:hypothetical protein
VLDGHAGVARHYRGLWLVGVCHVLRGPAARRVRRVPADPCLLGIGIVTFILTAVIALAPTAAEIVEEADLMSRIGRPQYQEYQEYQQYQQSDPYPPEDGAGPAQDPFAEPGSLFRDHRSHPKREDE